MSLVSEYLDYLQQKKLYGAESIPLFDNAEAVYQIRWLQEAEPSLSADDLRSIPMSILKPMYKNVILFGPNGDKVAKLLEYLFESNVDEGESTKSLTDFSEFVNNAPKSAGDFFEEKRSYTDLGRMLKGLDEQVRKKMLSPSPSMFQFLIVARLFSGTSYELANILVTSFRLLAWGNPSTEQEEPETDEERWRRVGVQPVEKFLKTL